MLFIAYSNLGNTTLFPAHLIIHYDNRELLDFQSKSSYFVVYNFS